MRYLTIVVAVLMFALALAPVLAAEGEHPEEAVVEPAFCHLDSLTVGMTLDTNPGTPVWGLYDNFCFSTPSAQVKLTVEYWSDGYDRYTLYAGAKSCATTTAAVRWDDSSRLWIGANHVQKLSDELTLVARPLLGANSATEDRLYLILGYNPGRKVGATACLTMIDANGKTEDLHLGPTYQNGRTNVWAAANVTNGGIYLDVSYSVPFK